MKNLDLHGARYGKLVGIRQTGKDKWNYNVWLMQCDCGQQKEVSIRRLRMKKEPTRSCGCAQIESAKRIKLAPGEAARNFLFSGYKHAAKIRGIAFALGIEEFSKLTSSNCHYCGKPPSGVCRGAKTTYTPYYFNGIDRRDNEIGYVPENCLPCCKTCNLGKHTMPYAQFIQHLDNLIEFRRRMA